MPIVLKRKGAPFLIYGYFKDHGRAHIHVYRGKYKGPVLVVEFPGRREVHCTMKANDRSAAIRYVAENSEEIAQGLAEIEARWRKSQ